MRPTHAATVLALVASLGLAPAPAQGQTMDSLAIGPVMAAALGEITRAFPIGRVVVDRVVIDTSMRLAPPLMSRREHPRPEDWARVHHAETVPTELAAPECNTLRTQCRLRGDIVGVVAFGDPMIWGDSARVIVRYLENFGEPVVRVRTTVVELTLRKSDGEWRVRRERIRAVG